MTKDQKKILKFIYEIDKLKTIYRQLDIESNKRRESSAEHSWHLAMMVWLFAKYFEQKINLEKVIKMALTHDLVEIYNGDIFFFDKEARINKHANEKKAAQKLYKLLPPKDRKELMDLWLEYEELKTPESRFIQAMDKIHPMLQNILNKGVTWHRVKVTVDMIVESKNYLMKDSKMLSDFFKTIISDIKKKKIAFKN